MYYFKRISWIQFEPHWLQHKVTNYWMRVIFIVNMSNTVRIKNAAQYLPTFLRCYSDCEHSCIIFLVLVIIQICSGKYLRFDLSQTGSLTTKPVCTSANLTGKIGDWVIMAATFCWTNLSRYLPVWKPCFHYFWCRYYCCFPILLLLSCIVTCV